MIARLFTGFIIIFSIQSCGYVGGSNPSQFASSQTYSTPPTFQEIQANILQPKCLSCHNSGAYTFTSYSSLMTSGVVIADNPLGSLLYQQIAAGLMPQGGPFLASTDTQAVYDWISAGATPGTSTPAPNAPTLLVATATSQSTISLTWTLPTQTVTGVKVERATASTGPFSTIANLSVVSSYSDSGLTASTTYYYRVSVSNASGTSPVSNVANVTTSAAPPPAAPSSLLATASSSSEIDLTWTDNSNNETGFQIERGLNSSGPFTLIATTLANATSYADTGLSSSTTYYYQIDAANVAGNSAFTSVASATTPAPPVVPPAAPSGLIATTISSSEIDLSWTDNSNNETSFNIERATALAGPYTLIKTTAANTTSYADTGLSAVTTYYYRVYAANSAGNSADTSIANATTLVSPPTAPSGLAATAASATEIDLTWTDNSSNETAFSIERSTSSAGPFTVVGSVGPNVTSFADSGLSAATTYYYRVDAQNAGGNSGYTSVSSALTFGTYTWLATNIFQPKCVSCHSGPGAQSGYHLDSYGGATTQVAPGNSAGSGLYQMVLSGAMPQGGTPLTAAQLNAVMTWIDSGAANN
jgi:hypothetical protein